MSWVQLAVQVTKAKVTVEQAPWQRVTVEGQAHKHGARHTLSMREGLAVVI